MLSERRVNAKAKRVHADSGERVHPGRIPVDAY
jgi:hypothetical protein